MTAKYKLTFKDTASFLGGLAPITISRIVKADSTFPKPEKIGRSIFFDETEVCEWVTQTAGFEVKPTDEIINSKRVQEFYDKSYTWVWQNVKEGEVPKPFKIAGKNFWVKSQLTNLFSEEK